ncbi:uncharacterized protein N7518_010450 [Penicillium psychrosexuale]|uniref:uncharacterized protein n=1 Tax=Penicillium psychrosexuale TaxID=1002107 RepID=UPI0025456570|nr:uncharacterized protein N7518_010450 [Penicillium psychrosexuale]KAJ5781967.1 hypothetical protein N7518_010450 [Penicillium psychrosexuale]
MAPSKCRSLQSIGDSSGSDDFDASTAELYGWINRAIPDADYEGFVDHFAHRVAGFDARPLVEAKRVVNARSGLPTDVDFFSSMRLCIQMAQTPERAARSKILRSKGYAQEGEVELNMGKILAEVTFSDLP